MRKCNHFIVAGKSEVILDLVANNVNLFAHFVSAGRIL